MRFKCINPDTINITGKLLSVGSKKLVGSATLNNELLRVNELVITVIG